MSKRVGFATKYGAITNERTPSSDEGGAGMSLYLQCDNCARVVFVSRMAVPTGWTGSFPDRGMVIGEHRCDICNTAGEEARQAAYNARFNSESPVIQPKQVPS